jgi:transcriptional regulator with XRE-family HTH domain
MGEPIEPTAVEVGERIRRLRRSRNLSLRALSALTSLSPSFLCQLELGKTSASLNSLVSITAALGTTFAHLMSDESMLARPGRKADRRPLTTGAYSEYVLTRRPSVNFEAYLGVLHPGGMTYPQMFIHGDSEEFFYVISGTVHFYLEDTVYILGPGDIMEYRTSVPHRMENLETETAEILWVTSPPTVGRVPVDMGLSRPPETRLRHE